MGQDGGGQGNVRPQAHRGPVLQREGSREEAHPELRALHVDQELRRDAALPGGGVKALQLPRRPGEAHVGEVQPDAGHAGLKEAGQGFGVGTGGAKRAVDLNHQRLPSAEQGRQALRIRGPADALLCNNAGNQLMVRYVEGGIVALHAGKGHGLFVPEGLDFLRVPEFDGDVVPVGAA